LNHQQVEPPFGEPRELGNSPFTGEENCGGVSRSSNMPPRVHSSRKPVESMPAHLLSIPSPSGEEGVDTETTILRLVAIDSTATAEREREGGRLWRERERDCERGCLPDAAEVVESEV